MSNIATWIIAEDYAKGGRSYSCIPFINDDGTYTLKNNNYAGFHKTGLAKNQNSAEYVLFIYNKEDLILKDYVKLPGNPLIS